jgi:hypothetical protein
MNKQLEELLYEACKQSLFEPVDPTMTISGGDTPITFARIIAEKFAELLIQECAKIARATPCPYDDTTPMLPQLGHTWDMACLESGRQIIQHFGVK